METCRKHISGQAGKEFANKPERKEDQRGRKERIQRLWNQRQEIKKGGPTVFDAVKGTRLKVDSWDVVTVAPSDGGFSCIHKIHRYKPYERESSSSLLRSFHIQGNCFFHKTITW